MKIIDKTPLLNEKGELGFMQRIQGMLKYGFDWPSELQAQKAIINYFDRQLEKGYTLIRNYTLGKSGITVPIILLGPSGIHVIHVAYLKGRYEARADAWNVASGDGYKPAPDNLIQQTMRMARAVRAFIERQGVQVPVEIEAVLIGGDPGTAYRVGQACHPGADDRRCQVLCFEPADRTTGPAGGKRLRIHRASPQPASRRARPLHLPKFPPCQRRPQSSRTRSLPGRRRSSRPPRMSSPTTRRILTLP